MVLPIFNASPRFSIVNALVNLYVLSLSRYQNETSSPLPHFVPLTHSHYLPLWKCIATTSLEAKLHSEYLTSLSPKSCDNFFVHCDNISDLISRIFHLHCLPQFFVMCNASLWRFFLTHFLTLFLVHYFRILADSFGEVERPLLFTTTSLAS